MNLSLREQNASKLVENDNLLVRLLQKDDPIKSVTLEESSVLPLVIDEPHVLNVFIETGGGVNNYETLSNKPTLNGVTIIGDISEKDPTVPEWIKTMQVMTEQELEELLT